MTTTCQQCRFSFDDGPRMPKVLPCGHCACLSCLRDYARRSGSLCPVCRKVFKAEPLELIDNLVLLDEENKWWCTACECDALPRCFQLHPLRPVRPLLMEARAAMVAARTECGAVLVRLAQDVRVEGDRLRAEAEAEEEAVAADQLDLAGLRAAVAAARAHPLRVLTDEEQPLQRALQAVQEQAALREKEETLMEKAVMLGSKERNQLRLMEMLRTKNAELKTLEVSVKERDELLTAKEASLKTLQVAVEKREAVLEVREATIREKSKAIESEEAMKRREEGVVSMEAKLKTRREKLDEDARDMLQKKTLLEDELRVAREEAAVVKREAAALRYERRQSDRHSIATQSFLQRSDSEDLAHAHIDCLPDEVLVMVFSMVTTSRCAEKVCKATLPLRRVCLRWNRLVLSPAVWRHRKLSVTTVRGASMLRLIPVLDTLTVDALNDYERMFLAVMKCRLQIRALNVKFIVTVGASKHFRALLEVHEMTLEEVILEVRLYASNSDFSVVLSAVDNLRSLKKLTILPKNNNVDGDFTKLCALQELVVSRTVVKDTSGYGNNARDRVYALSGRLLHSVFSASKGTLRVAHCPDYEVLTSTSSLWNWVAPLPVITPVPAPVADCSLLQELTLRCGPELATLHRLTRLETLTVHGMTGKHLRLLRDLLGHDEFKPRSVRAHVALEEKDADVMLQDVAASLRAVSFLSLSSSRHQALTPRTLLDGLSLMPDLATLIFDKCVFFSGLADDWTAETAPRLRTLHVEGAYHQHAKAKDVEAAGDAKDPKDPKDPHAWVARLADLLPGLNVCPPLGCKERHY